MKLPIINFPCPPITSSLCLPILPSAPCSVCPCSSLAESNPIWHLGRGKERGEVEILYVCFHTPPSSAEVKKELSYTSTHPMGPPGPVTGFPLPLPLHVFSILRV